MMHNIVLRSGLFGFIYISHVVVELSLYLTSINLHLLNLLMTIFNFNKHSLCSPNTLLIGDVFTCDAT